MSDKYSQMFDGIVEKAKSLKTPMRVALAGSESENILLGLFDAQADGFAEPVLIGNYKKTMEILEKHGLSDRKFDFQPIPGDTSPVQYAIEMINAGNADCLLRGNTQTRDFLLPILYKSNHFHDDGLLSHVVLVSVPGYHKLLAISDVTIIIKPSMEQRIEEIKNMVKALNLFGVKHPNIALLSMVEKPSFHIRDSVEASTIIQQHAEEPIADCNIVGPITYDLIISKEAAELKHYKNECCGNFDGIIVPELMAGNLMMKVLLHNTDANACGLIVGGKVPIAIPGRSDRKEQTYLSLATCACQWMGSQG
jgi:phosphotransacetylase